MSYKNHFKRIRESEYFIRRKIEQTLKAIQFDEEIKEIAGNHDTYFDMWQATYGDKFYDMTTIVRLGTTIEMCLKDYYQSRKGFSSRKELKDHINSKQNIFQQVFPWHNQGILTKIESEFQVELFQIPQLKIMQETMLFRHLYAHNSGLLDKKFVDDYKRLSNIDLSSSSSEYRDYEIEDYFYFEPLKKVSHFIDGTEKFFDKLYAL
ncbi:MULTISPECIES: hypothetical protein [unclassified Pseudoalteromonas]|uniref:hypothetical protein n=1 Tax=unclassified Pseudoalteromonas TaxID=194690 RepID=UPI000C7C89B2|nr:MULTISPECIES: hypothetical protein [unclassified Pseudoalteromonas]AUJ69771.1 hypothetical protein PNC201_07365 [Pseudoalteromonas sp. NC201]MCO7198490.1 hypothetical protein [Pseudoalteromonas sp. OANN1]